MAKKKIVQNAIISVDYNGKVYKSCEIPLDDNSLTTKIILDIADNGTENITKFKLPLTDTSFMIFSKKQIDQSVFTIELLY